MFMAKTRSIRVRRVHVHSSVRGRLGCFLSLAVVNSAAVNIEGVPASFQIMVFSGSFSSFNGFLQVFILIKIICVVDEPEKRSGGPSPWRL